MTAGPLVRRLAPAALVIGLVGVAAPAQAGESADAEKALAAVKASHDKYQDVKVAIADGFMPTDSCVTHETMGTMGFHYVNPKLIAAPIDQDKPAILVYGPDGDGVKLLAVEWFQPDADQDLSTSEDKPTLFGRPFDGPMEGHEPGMPRHYDEHAWLWLDNPEGTLEPYNPAASCKGAKTIVTVPAMAMPAHEGMADEGMADEGMADEDDEAGTDGATDGATDGQVTHTPTGGADAGGGVVDSNSVLLVGLGVAVAAAGGLTIGAAGRARRRS